MFVLFINNFWLARVTVVTNVFILPSGLIHISLKASLYCWGQVTFDFSPFGGGRGDIGVFGGELGG